MSSRRPIHKQVAPKPPPPKVAISYVRFSRAEQRTGDSIRRQVENTERYCRDNNLCLDKSYDYLDQGVSAFSGRNVTSGGLGRFLEAARAGKVPSGCALIVESLDRLSRQTPMASFGLLKEITDLGIEIHFTSTRTVIKRDTDPGALFMALGSAVRAHEESALKSSRLRAAWVNLREKAKKGHLLTQTVPWWLQVTNGKHVVIPERASVVKRIFQMSAAGMSSAAISQQLNDEGVPVWNQKQQRWFSARIRGLIQSDAPLGVLQATPKTRKAGRNYQIPRYYPTVVSRDLADQARQTAKRNLKGSRGRPNAPAKLPSIFRGLLRGGTDVPAVITWANRWPANLKPKQLARRYYYCVLDGRNTGRSRSLFNVNGLLLERIILSGLTELTLEDVAPPKVSGAMIEMARLERLVGELQIKVANLMEAVESGSAGAANRLVDREAELQRAQAELAEIKAETKAPAEIPPPAEFTAAIASLHQNAARKRIHAALRKLVVRIHVAGDMAGLAKAPGFTLGDKVRVAKEITHGVSQARLCTIETPTSRPKDMVALVEFVGGAKRLIAFMAEKRLVMSWRFESKNYV